MLCRLEELTLFPATPIREIVTEESRTYSVVKVTEPENLSGFRLSVAVGKPTAAHRERLSYKQESQEIFIFFRRKKIQISEKLFDDRLGKCAKPE